VTKRNKINAFAAGFFALCVLVTLLQDTAFAHDDFGDIVRHIERTYHVHRSYGFLMGFAGLVVKVGHPAGVKSMKCALFEDQHLDETAADYRLDDIVREAGKSGWQPVVRSYSHRNGEHTYIYSKMDGKDLKLLLVSVEPSEAVVMQMKLNPDRLVQFLDEHTHPKHDADDGDLEAMARY
jgi:hypothetical protein